jgi:L-fuconolactonase
VGHALDARVRRRHYAQAVEPFRTTDRLSDSERAMLMGGACAKAYGWEPKKG